ncbi:MAG: HlyU family transcriptional regulator, partial [Aestuariivirga sp.]
MSFLKKLLGGAPEIQTTPNKSLAYNGFTITATPFKDGGQYQTCGVISKDVDGTPKEHKFIRADRFSSLDEAMDFSLRK